MNYKVFHSNQQSCVKKTTQNEARMIIQEALILFLF